MDANEQVVLVEWLGQVANDPGFQRARPHAVIGIGGNQDGGNRDAGCHQVTMQIEPAHLRHLHIRDQAGCTVQTIELQKILATLEGLREEPQCPH